MSEYLEESVPAEDDLLLDALRGGGFWCEPNSEDGIVILGYDVSAFSIPVRLFKTARVERSYARMMVLSDSDDVFVAECVRRLDAHVCDHSASDESLPPGKAAPGLHMVLVLAHGIALHKLFETIRHVASLPEVWADAVSSLRKF